MEMNWYVGGQIIALNGAALEFLYSFIPSIALHVVYSNDATIVIERQ